MTIPTETLMEAVGLVITRELEPIRKELVEERAKVARLQGVVDTLLENQDELAGLGDDLVSKLQDVELAFRSGTQANAKAVEDLDGKVESRHADLKQLFDAASGVAAIEGVKDLLRELAPSLKGEQGPPGFLAPVGVWSEGTPQPTGSLVRHQGGTWQATQPTVHEPGPSAPHWVLVSDGVHQVEVVQQAPLRLELVTRMASGLEFIHSARLPWFDFSKGKWSQSGTISSWTLWCGNATCGGAVAPRPKGNQVKANTGRC